MQLIDLIAWFRGGGTFDDFCEEHSLNAESEAIEIYAQEPLNLESELGFFPVEETEGRVEIHSQGVKYHNLFDFFYFLEVVKDLESNATLSDGDLAQKLFAYAVKDA